MFVAPRQSVRSTPAKFGTLLAGKAILKEKTIVLDSIAMKTLFPRCRFVRCFYAWVD
jgi:hypothetical protein